MMRLSVCLLALACGLPAQIIANINDARSHGSVGDNLLSLDEGIQLANGTIAISALSSSERAQLSGLSGVVGRMVVRAAVTPVITVERLLSDVIGQHHSHVHIEIIGIDGPTGPPVIDGNSQPIALPIRMNDATLENLTFRGGHIAIEYDSTLHYHPGENSEFSDLLFEGQRDVALRIVNPRSPPGMQAPMLLRDVRIRGTTTGIEIADSSQFGNTDIRGDLIAISDCDVGIRLLVDSIGSVHYLQLLRSQVTAVDRCITIDRLSGASTSRWRVRLVHGTYRAFDRAFDVVSSASGTTAFELHHLEVRGGVGATSHALTAGPQNGHVDLLATECHFVGPIAVAAGAATSAVRMHNNRFEAGALSLSLAAGSGDWQWNNFTSFPIEITPAASSLTAPLTFTGCELVRSDLTDRSPGRSRLTACYLGGSVVSANVQNLQPQLTAWIGRATVTPQDPPAGTYVDLAVDLQPGTAAGWLLSTAIADPITTAMPFRYYLDMTAPLVLPGLHVFASRVRMPIPAVNALRGRAFYAQPVQVTTQVQPVLPTVLLPVGGPIVVQ
jgi:hypothetical protein